MVQVVLQEHQVVQVVLELVVHLGPQVHQGLMEVLEHQVRLEVLVLQVLGVQVVLQVHQVLLELVVLQVLLEV